MKQPVPFLETASGYAQRVDFFKDFRVFGEASDVVLAPDLRVVDAHIEYAALTLDERGIHVVFRFEGIRQTDGCRFVVSLHAELNGYFHR